MEWNDNKKNWLDDVVDIVLRGLRFRPSCAQSNIEVSLLDVVYLNKLSGLECIPTVIVRLPCALLSSSASDFYSSHLLPHTQLLSSPASVLNELLVSRHAVSVNKLLLTALDRREY